MRGFLGENLKGRCHVEDLGVDERIILNWILKVWNRRAWAGFIWLSKGTVGMLL